MAYNTSKGPRGLGDIKNEDDPDTQIDFGTDQIALATGGAARLTVTNVAVTSAVALTASAFSGDGSALQGITGSGGIVTAYTNATDNYVLTSAGAGSINGEASLLYDGSTLTVGGNLLTQVAALPVAQFIHPNDDATGAVLELINSRANNPGQANDFCGGLTFKSKDSTSVATQYSKISTKIGSPTNTSEAGYMLFEVTTAGTSATTYLRLDGPTSAITASMNTLIDANLNVSGNVGIGTTSPGYDLHVNGTGVTEATIDGGASSDAYLRFATNGVAKSYVKLGSGGALIVAQDATGGDLLLKAKPSGVSTTYLTLDGGASAITASVNTLASADLLIAGALHQNGSNYRKYTNKSISYTLTNTDSIVYIGHGSNILTASLPDATTVDGIVYTIKNSNSAALVIKPSGSQTIDGGGALTGSLGQSWTLAANSDVWMALSSHSSSA
tara:strand:- start:856 stop:2187 length:1332 start_codon:yes stop_codon:yes gene_type:complete